MKSCQQPATFHRPTGVNCGGNDVNAVNSVNNPIVIRSQIGTLQKYKRPITLDSLTENQRPIVSRPFAVKKWGIVDVEC